jgi:hypothetical protein
VQPYSNLDADTDLSWGKLHDGPDLVLRRAHEQVDLGKPGNWYHMVDTLQGMAFLG